MRGTEIFAWNLQWTEEIKGIGELYLAWGNGRETNPRQLLNLEKAERSSDLILQTLGMSEGGGAPIPHVVGITVEAMEPQVELKAREGSVLLLYSGDS